MGSRELKEKLEVLRDSTHLAIKEDIDLMHRVYMLKARIALHEVKGEWDKIPPLLKEYEGLARGS